MNIQVWVKGALLAAATGAATAAAAVIQQGGLNDVQAIVTAAIAGAVGALAGYVTNRPGQDAHPKDAALLKR